MRCDVLVVGGGSAGVAAAVAAARNGAHTVLVERQGSLGGMASAALVHSICGLYLLTEKEEAVFANPGFPMEFATRLLKSGGAIGPVRMGRVHVLLQHPTAFAHLCDVIVSQTKNLSVRFHTEVIGATTDSTEICCRGVRETIEPRTLVDASGDAALAAFLNAECEQENGARLQRPAFIFSMLGVNENALSDDGRLRLAHRIVAAVR